MTTSVAAASTPAVAEHPARAALLLGALGVVFGDIGTSPIYAFRESLKASGGASAEATVLGVLSLVFWAVVLIVYVALVTALLPVAESIAIALIVSVALTLIGDEYSVDDADGVLPSVV